MLRRLFAFVFLVSLGTFFAIPSADASDASNPTSSAPQNTRIGAASKKRGGVPRVSGRRGWQRPSTAPPPNMIMRKTHATPLDHQFRVARRKIALGLNNEAEYLFLHTGAELERVGYNFAGAWS